MLKTNATISAEPITNIFIPHITPARADFRISNFDFTSPLRLPSYRRSPSAKLATASASVSNVRIGTSDP
jgi:hypothetical protein